jgi:hypothetical protein
MTKKVKYWKPKNMNSADCRISNQIVKNLGIDIFMETQVFEYRHMLSETPIFQFRNRSSVKSLQDFEISGGPWLVSQRMKDLLDAFDPESFDAVLCKTLLKKGDPGPDHWLLNVTRVVDAIDTERSVFKTLDLGNGKFFYDFSGFATRRYKEDIDPKFHIFRTLHREPDILVDNEFRHMCKTEKITGIQFYKAEMD